MGLLIAQALAVAAFVVGPCPGQPNAIACVDQPATVYATVWPLPRRYRDHELGHVLDNTLLTNADRGTFEYLTHQRRAWIATAANPNSPQEQFAEAFRMCARSMTVPDGNSLYGYDPGVKVHRRVCRWLADSVAQAAPRPQGARSGLRVLAFHKAGRSTYLGTANPRGV